MAATLALGIDVGGTRIAFGLVGPDGSTRAVEVHALIGRGDAVVDQLVAVARTRLALHDVTHVGVAVPGPVDATAGLVLSALTLGWRELPLADRLRTALGRDVLLSNDGHAAAWAEHRFGAGRGRDTVLVSVGTGIGGGAVLAGRVVEGHRALGGGWGHLPLVAGGRACTCGAAGCWEQYASGTALITEARRSWNARTTCGEQVLAAAENGDRRAAEVVTTVSGHLAHGLTILGACLGPHEIVLGGELGCDPRLARHVRHALADRGTHPTRTAVTTTPAELGTRAGLVGAADLARA
ncbi:ROK family protein [Nocardia sp. NRRL S-836]|uniref:ROK family protein n=1 Tax=Nocardia sp. NRRL S-836 TaxID=1519492 RepID=UPI0006AE3786|nr:ROK family protein [Nocardia sp. NRRL S-836]